MTTFDLCRSSGHPRGVAAALGSGSSEVVPSIPMAPCPNGRIMVGAHRGHMSENCSETLRTAETPTAGQLVRLVHPPRSEMCEHKTRPTGRLTPFPPPDLRLVVVGGRPLCIRCTCAGRACIRGLDADDECNSGVQRGGGAPAGRMLRALRRSALVRVADRRWVHAERRLLVRALRVLSRVVLPRPPRRLLRVLLPAALLRPCCQNQTARLGPGGRSPRQA